MVSGGIENFEDPETHNYLPLPNHDHTISADDNRLQQLGYKQELSRRLSALENFSVTFSIVSVITSITALYGNGLTFGGPVTMVYGWPMVGMLTMVVGLSMAEICSAYPTSGGLYFWSARLCGYNWGPMASWFPGWVFSNFAFSFSIISVLTGITTLYTTGLNFGGPVSLQYGWYIAGFFTMIVGLAMTEICSSYPTSGGLYYWSAMCRPGMGTICFLGNWLKMHITCCRKCTLLETCT